MPIAREKNSRNCQHRRGAPFQGQTQNRTIELYESDGSSLKEQAKHSTVDRGETNAENSKKGVAAATEASVNKLPIRPTTAERPKPVGSQDIHQIWWLERAEEELKTCPNVVEDAEKHGTLYERERRVENLLDELTSKFEEERDSVLKEE
ncbi:tRNA pseudouridine synthase A [Anopheles sinensis]|uniref:tRNA pseudouridine synthase A n=1 Tax=Anopheles sinensis TaxID=74873 RepID=A0A084WB74_ANOSI|nr:tRNA pseudouridine synthase A [Anopheles sinensis]